MLNTDGRILENGTLITRAGALLASKGILKDLEKLEDALAASEAEQRPRATEAGERRIPPAEETVHREKQRTQNALQSEVRRQARIEENEGHQVQREERAIVAAQRPQDKAGNRRKIESEIRKSG
ncbi:hypothetical protein FGB62_219g016 [Gracilaria domingensis]|nr:hypothetical protein FGB62_219g016 [Gracilaria domingensis]